MSPDQVKAYAAEFMGVFAPAMPPHGYEKLIAEMANWEPITDRLIAVVEVAERGHCQHDDCYELAEISEAKTSLSFCTWHYYKRMGRRNASVMTDYALRAHRGEEL